MPIVSFLLIGIFSVSVLNDSVFADRNGGGVYVGKNSIFNMTRGTLTGFNISGNGGAVYVSEGGTFNMTACSIYGNTATLGGNNIYNAGTFTMTGGKIGKQMLTYVDESGNKDKNGNYVYFGSYPQTLKESNITIDENDVDDKGYFLGSDGERYLKLTAHAPYYGDIIYNFSDGSTITVGSTYYFKVEPIKWKIVKESEGKLTLYAESVLDQTVWSSSNGLNYKESTVREFINGTFYNTAFAANEKNLIQTTEVDNSASSLETGDDALACENTNDKVFLFSIADVFLSTGFLGYTSSEQRKKVPTDYARASGLYMESTIDENKNNAMYWTRSPSSNNIANMAYDVSYSGEYSHGGVSANLGVAPAIVVSNLETDNDYGIYNTGTMNLYGGMVNDNIYSSTSFNTKMAAKISGNINLGSNAIVYVKDYTNVTPTYNIVVPSARSTSVLVNFGQSDTKPDYSCFVVTNAIGETLPTYVLKNDSDEWVLELFGSPDMQLKVKFDALGGNVSPTEKTVKYREKYRELPTPTKDGYSFVGWSLNYVDVDGNVFDLDHCTRNDTTFTFDTGSTNTNEGSKFFSVQTFKDSAYIKEIFYVYGAGKVDFTFTKDSSFDVLRVKLNGNNMDSYFRIDVSGLADGETYVFQANISEISMNHMVVNGVKIVKNERNIVTNIDDDIVTESTIVRVPIDHTVFARWRQSFLATDWKTKICTNSGGNSDGFCKLENITSISFVNTIPTGYIGSPISVGANNENGGVIASLNREIIDVLAYAVKNSDTSYSIFFYSPIKIYLGNAGNEGVDDSGTLRALSGGCQFYSLSGVTSFNFSNLDTSKATNMSGMFFNCLNVTSLDLSGFDTSNVEAMSHMFYNCRNLTSVDLSSFNTEKVKSTKNMFCNFVGTSLDLSKFNTVNVADMNGMFLNCSNLTNLDVTKFNTSNVTDMSNMFYNCSKLTSLDVSNFDTSKVTTMYYMFRDCASLKSLNLENWKTPNNISLQSFVYGCLALETLTFGSNFDTSNVTDMGSAFRDTSLSSLDLSSFDTSKVKDMGGMFQADAKLETINFGSKWNTKSVETFYIMFDGCNKLSELDLSGWNTSNATDFGGMFTSCGFSSLDISSFRTTKATSMLAMFKDCSNLTRLDLHNFYVWNVTDMKDMFSGCSSLVYLDLSSFNLRNISSENYEGMLNLGASNMIEVLKTPYVSYFEGMFNPIIKITTGVDGLYNEDGGCWSKDSTTNQISLGMNAKKSMMLTSNAPGELFTNWKYDLRNNFGIQYEDVTSIKFAAFTPEGYSYVGKINGIKVYRKSGTNDIAFVACKILASSNSESLFSDLTSLEEIYFDVFSTENVTNMNYMFKNCSSLKNLDLRKFTIGSVKTITGSGIKYKFIVEMFYNCSSLEYLDLSSFNMENFTKPSYLPSYEDSDFLNFGNNNNIKKIKTPYNVKVELKITTNSTLYDEGENVVTSVPKDTTTSLTFRGYDNVEFPQAWKTELSSSNYMTENIDASKLVDIKFVEEVPAGYTLIGTLSTGLKVYKGPSSNQIAFVASLINAPQSCKGLFQNLALLKNIDFETFRTTNVADMSYMFSGCENLLKLDLRNFRTTAMKVGKLGAVVSTDICDYVKYMFQNCKSLIYLDLSEFDMKNGSASRGDSNSYFLNFGTNNKIEVLKTPYNNYYVLEITTGSNLYDSSNKQVTRVSSKTTSSVTLKTYWETYSKTYLSTDWKTEISRTNYMSETVSYSEIEDIKFVSTVPEGYTLIGTLSPGLNVYKGATTKQIAFVAKIISAQSDCSSLFSDLTSLKYLSFENFDTSSVTNMTYMFGGCSSLISIDLRNFNTINVTSMARMFSGCSSLLKLDLSSFSTESLPATPYSSLEENIAHMFYNCTSLTYLDLSSFNLHYNGTQANKNYYDETFLDFGGTVPMLLFKAPYNNYFKLKITSMALVSVIPAGETESVTYTTGPLFLADNKAEKSICVISGVALEKANVVYVLPESKKKNTKIVVEDKVS